DELRAAEREVPHADHQGGHAEERDLPEEAQPFDELSPKAGRVALSLFLERRTHEEDRQGRERVGHRVDDERQRTGDAEERAAEALITSAAIITRFRSNRSATIPAGRLKSTIGANSAAWTIPALVGEPVTARTSSGNAIRETFEPKVESSCPPWSSTKSRLHRRSVSFMSLRARRDSARSGSRGSSMRAARTRARTRR